MTPIAAESRMFVDETDGTTNLELRSRCLRQLHASLAKQREELQPQIIAEAGAPLWLTYAVQLDSCIRTCCGTSGWHLLTGDPRVDLVSFTGSTAVGGMPGA